jgi:hypothetical protein
MDKEGYPKAYLGPNTLNLILRAMNKKVALGYPGIYICIMQYCIKKYKKMQNQPKTPIIGRPIARRALKKSNLGDASDQLKIYRACYKNHLEKHEYSPKLIAQLLNCFDRVLDRENIHQFFSLPITKFHQEFIQYLNSL